MFRKTALFIVDMITVMVDSIAETVVFLKNYAVQIWLNIVIRKLVYIVLDLFEAIVYRLQKYLEEVRIVLKYRIYYENVTKPMKYYYKEYRKK